MLLNMLGIYKEITRVQNLVIQLLISLATLIPNFIHQNKFIIFSLIFTLVFYWPSFGHGSTDAGFLYMGDNIGFYIPALFKAHALISSLNFTALDFSSFNGSSDFFLAANFFAVHPALVIYALLVPFKFTNMHIAGQVLVIMCAIHSLIACYFSLKLLTRFFNFGFGSSAFVATIFTFSIYMVSALGEPEYLFCICIIPWVAYSTLVYAENSSTRNFLIACLPILGGVLGGYIPLGLTALLLSLVLIITKLFVVDNATRNLEGKIYFFWKALLPFIGSVLILSPYLYAVNKFLQASPSAKRPDIFFSAHQLSEQPETILRLFSHYLSVPGPFFEFSVLWGFIPVAICVIFLSSKKAIESLSSVEWSIFRISGGLYFTVVLAIFGNFSPVSDLVYYFVPQIGKMHIYQRFLLPMNLFFGVMIALMLKSLIEQKIFNATRNMLAIYSFALISSAYLVAKHNMLASEIGLNGYVIFELLLGVLFLFALITPSKTFIYGVAIIFVNLPVLNLMYDYSIGLNTNFEQKKRLVVALDDAERAKLVTYLNRFGDKKIIKYIDITPRWTADGIEPFPKSFPYFVLKELPISSYTGFNFYLSSLNEYMQRMPILGQQVILSPDWEMAANTGADFIVALASDIEHASADSIFANINKDEIYRLPHNVVIAPLHFHDNNSRKGEIFDNGYFKVSRNHISDDRELINLSTGKKAWQSSTLGSATANLAVDGNVDGDFNHGSVTHTLEDKNAWLEIDLGTIEPIDNVQVWNRTDCCVDRLKDFWVFISETPFLPDDTVSKLHSRPNTWAYHINTAASSKFRINANNTMGRYVRIQLDGSNSFRENYLSVAETQVFRSGISQESILSNQEYQAADIRVADFSSNGANYLRLELESSVSASVEYLLWKNPRLEFFLNGTPAKLVDREGLLAINILPGHNIIEARYHNSALSLFWFFYACYGLALIWSFAPNNIYQKTSSKLALVLGYIKRRELSLIEELKLNLRYGVAGGLNGLFGLSTIWLLTKLGVHPIATNFIGFLVGVAFAFLMSKKFVFRSQGHFNSEAVRYITAFCISYIINIIVLQICTAKLSMDALVSQGIAISTYVILMYSASRFYIFRKNKI
ncbi:MAG: hypothetical protein CTY29_02490 [Methylobacter sp.]|nr:MAG: hypothetical protein CTY29_02490 [Methylobacter sp.]